ncbi:SDR family NAD(P)-dependent oxidoreductase [Sporosarcina siberiensis]|uniref:SDR family NAD(P)-dependent oxidoreductase n=1 Tax=Sporosarcina siberiensis TaxID=1365606 RepID=A0ABW4SCF7_9BACL
MDVFIITGASKGIGFELSKQLQSKDKMVIGIARTNPEDVENFITVNLKDTSKLHELIENVISKYSEEATSFTLINNAGMVDPIGLVGDVEAVGIEEGIAVNLTAPMILSNAFITELKNFTGTKRIVNISSGAGRNAYEGWGTYCATKAGLDHFSRVVGLEQANADYPVDIVSIAPGIIDTGMQETIRASDDGAFPLLGKFIAYKEQGILSSAEQTAQKIIGFIENIDFKVEGPIVNIRDF